MSINIEKNQMLKITIDRNLFERIEQFTKKGYFRTKSNACSYLMAYALDRLESEDSNK